MTNKYQTEVENIWDNFDSIQQNNKLINIAMNILNEIIDLLNNGGIRTCEKENNIWITNIWVKQAILLYFRFAKPIIYKSIYGICYDKINPKFNKNINFIKYNQRIVPGSIVREGTYIGHNVIIMPSFINIGAYIDDRTMIDSYVTIGSCAYIGKNCHISEGVCIGGVLEPLQNNPVIIENNCFIGAKSSIVEGVIVEEGSVIAAGSIITTSTKIIYKDTGEIIYGKIPAYSVVVPGSFAISSNNDVSLSCVVIVKSVDQKTREKTSINELLRS